MKIKCLVIVDVSSSFVLLLRSLEEDVFLCASIFYTNIYSLASLIAHNHYLIVFLPFFAVQIFFIYILDCNLY